MVTAEPSVFFHGGPGAGIGEGHFNLVDPLKNRVIFFDQRGVGKSTPPLSLDANNTWELVKDTEKIREFLKIETWFVIGGSWGSTLGLAYSTHFPHRVRGGVFWATTEYTQSELQKMCAIFPQFYPDRWQMYVNEGGTKDYKQILAFEYAELTSKSPERFKASVQRSIPLWSAGLTLDPTFRAWGPFQDSMMLLFNHYAVNHGFFISTTVPSAMSELLAKKPVHILHGRYDMRCFAETAYKVHRSIPGSTFEIIENAAHGASDPAMAAAIKEAILDVCRK